MLTITLSNRGGAVETRQARDAAAAALEIQAMARECGEFYDGDSITVSGHEEDAD